MNIERYQGGDLMNFFSKFLEGREIRKLAAEYVRQSGLTAAEAHRSLERQTERLQISRPGKSQLWYMEKILYDLQRDRGRS
ncbi:MAG TPA: hypothetical protein VN426_12880 [Syntrophomonadaceae bacterium]|nr:hypothetical protein [Syntrophomonadaceae bacterium]